MSQLIINNLKDKNFKVLKIIPNKKNSSYDLAHVECTKCNTKYSTTFTSGIKCNICSMDNNKRHKPHQVYLMLIDDKYIGFGHSSNARGRTTTHSNTLNSVGMSSYPIGYISTTKEQAVRLEYLFKFHTPLINLQINGFKKECTHRMYINLLLKIIDENNHKLEYF